MSVVTQSDIKRATLELGITNGDVVLVHSSFKSLGEVDGGAEAVIRGFLEAIGHEGTLVFPTFTQKNYLKAYETWHIDKESDTGYLTNYFRKREGSIRSDQATHSVAAGGRLAEFLTKTHGHTHKRFGNAGDTPFSADSPWEKMYELDAKIVLLGVSPLYITFRHYAEYIYVNEMLENLLEHPEYDAMKARLEHFGKPGVWPHVYNPWVAERLEESGSVVRSKCGNAVLTM
ncbi:MAG: AAC(3) family N-acetyltransferase, partial [Clostridia bacterium]|nr:AAC(3) family N-acetyltransferase [Clostridia bacterium]